MTLVIVIDIVVKLKESLVIVLGLIIIIRYLFGSLNTNMRFANKYSGQKVFFYYNFKILKLTTFLQDPYLKLFYATIHYSDFSLFENSAELTNIGNT